MSSNDVMIGTVALGQPEWSYVKSLVSLKAPGAKVFNPVIGKQGIDEGHNRLNEEFLASGCEWLLSVDSDAVLHPDTLMRLMSWEQPIVSALAVGRVPPFACVAYGEATEKGTHMRETDAIREWAYEHPVVMQVSTPIVIDPRPDDALMEIQRSGAHCLLTHRSVIASVTPPWFVRTGKNAKEGRGSDFYFSARVKEAGYDIYLDRSVVAGHIVHGHVANLLDFMVWDSVINYETQRIEVPTRGPVKE